MANNRFQVMKAQAEVLEKLDTLLNEIIKDNTMMYAVIGKQTEQATDWRTGELKWEDEEHTIPYYANEYGYVPIPEDEMTDENRIMLDVCKKFSQKLDKLLG